jgi:serine/threonine protein kinase
VITDLRVGDPDMVGPYRLVGRLGGGGMGQVYLARSPGGRTVAVKVIRPELAEDEAFRARFAQEASAARNVSGVFTAAVIDADPQASTPWMATAYVPGPSLSEAVEKQGPLPVGSVRALAAGLAEGLQAIHAAGLVHRDLKPSNVLLAADGPRVIDFGISAAEESSRLTQAGYVMGSPGYLSPEQAMGEVGSEASDVFSLGAVLTFAATGAGPFGDGPTPAIVHRVVYERPDLERVPESLLALIGPCLSKGAENRPATGELLAWLSVWLDEDGTFSPEWLPPQVSATIRQYSPTALSAPPPSMDVAMGGPLPPPGPRAPVGQSGAAPTVAGAVAGAAAADAWADPAGNETGQILITRTATNMRRLLITCAAGLVVILVLGAGYVLHASGKSSPAATKTPANQSTSQGGKSSAVKSVSASPSASSSGSAGTSAPVGTSVTTSSSASASASKATPTVKPTPTPTPKASPTPSPTPSPSPSPTPTPTPTPTTSPTSTSTATTFPTSTSTATTFPTSTSTATTFPTSTSTATVPGLG